MQSESSHESPFWPADQGVLSPFLALLRGAGRILHGIVAGTLLSTHLRMRRAT